MHAKTEPVAPTQYEYKDLFILILTFNHVGHKSTIMCCQFSPDGNTFSSSSMDRTTRVWDIRILKPKVTLRWPPTSLCSWFAFAAIVCLYRGHTNAVTSCCFSPDSRHLCTASWDKQVLVWDIAVGTYRYCALTVWLQCSAADYSERNIGWERLKGWTPSGVKGLPWTLPTNIWSLQM